MSFNPAGTQWSVAPMDNNGVIGNFHPTPWEFNAESMNAAGIWIGGYRPIPNADGTYSCEILMTSSPNPTDRFEVHFVSNTRFIATKGGSLYRFGKKL